MIEPQYRGDKVFYPVMEHFYTLQGEGNFTGQAAYFIRIAGCDVGCSWCDVKESWAVAEDQFIDVELLVEEVESSVTKLVVITGGEPAMYNLTPLTERLKTLGVRLHIETSGAYTISGNLNWICVSPKRFKKPLLGSIEQADELKMIIVNRQDLIWAEELSQDCKEECILLLQPEWNKAEKVYPMIIQFIKEHPKWRLSLQLHKFLNIP